MQTDQPKTEGLAAVALHSLVGRLAAAVKEEGYGDTDCEAVLQILENEGPKVSVSKIQRRLRYGHHRAQTVLRCCEKIGVGYYETFEGIVMKSPNEKLTGSAGRKEQDGKL